MKPHWAYIWEYTDIGQGRRMRTFTQMTKQEFIAQLEGGFFGDVDPVPIEETKVDRNLVPYREPGVDGRVPRLPEFDNPTESELRQLWRSTRDPLVRRVILELVRVRRTMSQIDDYVATIRAEYGNSLVAMHMLRILIKEELQRAGKFG
ncbi:hypothetical protein [Burkholderia multivorans]|uniref:hypothetical protein n=2 Tax=Burkholderia multivorans TaxID=87883 RepID=UPI001589B144|nr:hypothetical protein [Burkholderia multivorans]MBU9313228.1 hypothetical protein [Burkholderia multivorans]MBU9576073.1 hypothetical protein [Burkholderia multivorans]MCA8415064.1 hypothetical protein [Burkholderia multivorans]MDN7965625.1 hypothetical protein [Burkholderia multivorans]